VRSAARRRFLRIPFNSSLIVSPAELTLGLTLRTGLQYQRRDDVAGTSPTESSAAKKMCSSSSTKTESGRRAVGERSSSARLAS
jgi:hypothetical protein